MRACRERRARQSRDQACEPTVHRRGGSFTPSKEHHHEAPRLRHGSLRSPPRHVIAMSGSALAQHGHARARRPRRLRHGDHGAQGPSSTSTPRSSRCGTTPWPRRAPRARAAARTSRASRRRSAPSSQRPSRTSRRSQPLATTCRRRTRRCATRCATRGSRVYATFSPDQKAVVRDALARRLAADAADDGASPAGRARRRLILRLPMQRGRGPRFFSPGSMPAVMKVHERGHRRVLAAGAAASAGRQTGPTAEDSQSETGYPSVMKLCHCRYRYMTWKCESRQINMLQHILTIPSA